MVCCHGQNLDHGLAPDRGDRAAARPGRRRRHNGCTLSSTADQFSNAGNGAYQRGHVGRDDHRALLRALGQLGEGFDILLSNEIVDGIDAASFDGVGDQLGRLSLSPSRPFPSLGIAEGGFLAALSLENSRLLSTSALAMAACFSPSASVMTARRSRSAFI